MESTECTVRSSEVDLHHIRKVQKSINANGVKRGNRREEVKLKRLRFDHTGLNKTLFMVGKKDTDKCSRCTTLENVEHILMNCNKYREERA